MKQTTLSRCGFLTALALIGSLQAVELPSGYRTVDYIEADGTQMVDTGIRPTPTQTLALDFSHLQNNGDWLIVLFGVGSSNWIGAPLFGVEGGSYKFGCNGLAGSNCGAFDSTTDRLSFDADFQNDVVRLYNESRSAWQGWTDIGTGWSDLSRTYCLFADSDGNFKSSYRLHSFQIWDNGVLVGDFVPCRDANRKAGLWDRVQGRMLFDTDGNGFVAPYPYEDLPPGYAAAEYIAGTGTQYLNTRYTLKAADKIECVVDVPQEQLSNPNVALYGTSFSWAYGARAVLIKRYDSAIRTYVVGATVGDDQYGNQDNSDGFYGRKVSMTDVGGRLTWTALDGSGYSGSIDSNGGAPVNAYNSLLIFDHNVIADYNDKVSNAGRDGSWASAVARLYSFTITDADGNKIRDLKPCYSPEGVPGMFDMTSGKFYGSETESPFQGPSTETLPAGFTALEYIASTPGGNQYINTDYKYRNFYTRVVCDMMAPAQQTAVANDPMAQHAVFGSHGNGDANGLIANAYDFYIGWYGTPAAALITRCSFYPIPLGVDNPPDNQFVWANGFPLEKRVTVDCQVDGSLPLVTVTPNGPTLRSQNSQMAGWGNPCLCPFYIFAADRAGTAVGHSAMRLYGFKVYEGETCTVDLVPCRNARGQAGLFDLKRGLFLANANKAQNAVPFVGSDEIVCCSWMKSDGTQYINTGYVPQANTKVDAIINFDSAASASHSHAAVFGVTAADGYDAFTLFRWNGNNNPLYVRGGGENAKQGTAYFYDHTINLVCEGRSAAWTVLDGADAGQHEAVSYSQGEPGAVKPGRNLYLFAFNENDAAPGSHIMSVMTLYSFNIYEGTTPVRAFVPAVDPLGHGGVVDVRTGEFRSIPGVNTVTWGGFQYQVRGTTMRLLAGTMDRNDFDARGAMSYSSFEKVGAGSVNVAGIELPFPALVVREGELVFADGQMKTCTITGVLTLDGGAAAKVDVDLVNASADVLAADELVLNASVENPFNLVAVPMGTELKVGETPIPLLRCAALQAGDEAKFSLSGVIGELAVVEGALVLKKREIPTTSTSVWTNGSGDGLWYNPENWNPAAVPTVTANFDLAGDQTTLNDGAFFLTSLVHGETAGAFIHNGTDPVTVGESLVNASTATQTFNLPLVLGSADGTFTVQAAGDIALNGPVTMEAATLVKTDEGTLMLPESTLPALTTLDVQGGTVDFAAGEQPLALTTSLAVAEGAGVTINSGTRAVTFAGPLANNGTVTVKGTGDTYFGSALTGTGVFNLTGGLAYFNAADTIPSFGACDASIAISYDGNTMVGTAFDGPIALSKTSGKHVYVNGSIAPDAGRLTLDGATWNAYDLYLGGTYGALTIGNGSTVSVAGTFLTGYAADSGAADLTVGAGGTLNLSSGAIIGNNGWTKQGGKASRDTLTVDGGTVDSRAGKIVLAANQPHADLVLNDGTLSAKGIQFYNFSNCGTADILAFTRPDASFTQRGGTLNLGADGFNLQVVTTIYEPYCMVRSGKPFADLVNGTLTAAADFSTSLGGFTAVFGAWDDADGAYTIDLNGHTVNWNTALAGTSDVTLQGEGKFNSVAAFKGVPSGKWTVNADADLSGAAGFAGGLELGEGVSASIDIGTDGAIEMLYQGVDECSHIANLKAYNGVYPYVVNGMDRLHQQTAAAEYPWNNFLYRGQFYVPEEATYYFGANFKGNPYIGGTDSASTWFQIDGVDVLSTAADGGSVSTGSRQLTPGWHEFRVFVFLDAADDGPARDDWKDAQMALGWTTTEPADPNAASAYRKFDASTLKMRVRGAGVARWERRNGYDKNLLVADAFTGESAGVLDTLTILRRVTDDGAAAEPLNRLAEDGNARLTGAFKAEKEGTYAFNGIFDDCLALFIDGTKAFETADWNQSALKNVYLDVGWHTFDIRLGDGGGAVGHDNALMVMRPGESTPVAFDEENFAFRTIAAPTAGLAGTIRLNEGATLTNVAAGACPLAGRLEGAGALVGDFAFTETGSLGVTVAQREVTSVPNIEGVTNVDFLRTLKKIEVTVDGDATSERYPIASAGTLTSQEASAIEVVVSAPGNKRTDGWRAMVRGGQLVLFNPRASGLTLILR